MLDTTPAHRWSWVEVDLSAIRRNVRRLMDITPNDTKFMAIVKADAYGHGGPVVARACGIAGADMFGVATLEEGIELRASGITAPILLLSEPPRTGIPAILENDLICAITTAEFALDLGEQAVNAGLTARYHLKIDTGMNRIGVNHLDVLEFLKLIDFHRGLERTGTFTHFATADTTPEDWDFALQLRRFKEAVTAMREADFDPGTVHAANSAAIIMHPEAHFDMVRGGIAMYGLHPSDSTRDLIRLEPAMSVRARATMVKEPSIGEGVSYGFTYRVPKSVQIATFPLGYADGMPRALSNDTQVLFDGRRCQQVGRICMDQFMIEVVSNPSALKPTHPITHGDVITVVGRDGDDEITLDDMAKRLGTINYELACRFGLRMDRIYTRSSAS